MASPNQDILTPDLGPDLERPLHRILPVWRFEAMLRLKQMTLLSPRKWEDPYEDLCTTFILDNENDGSIPQLSVAEHLAPAWALCWSYEANSDLLLRSYSRVELHPELRRNMVPGAEGVRVTTTASRLLKSIEQWKAELADTRFALGRVKYVATPDAAQSLANLIHGRGLRHLNTLEGRTHSLLLKRDYFRHEDEVRLICVGGHASQAAEPVRHFPIIPNDLFTEISFDPRLVSFERIERERTVRRLGYEGKVSIDASYQNTLHLVPMKNGWKE